MRAGIEYLWRLITDRKCRCVRCGGVVGYIARGGHSRWECATCATGAQPKAV